MNTLFPIQSVLPDGFCYHADFLTKHEETKLHEEILKIQLHNFIFHGFKANRKVASFGHDYSFEKKQLSKGKDIPASFDFLIDKVAIVISAPRDEFKQLLITEYPVGSVINWHRDAPPFDIITGISLLSDCTFRLRPYDKAKQNRASEISIPVMRRSLYIMKGPARSEWQHSTAPVKQIRYSITLRTLRN